MRKARKIENEARNTENKATNKVRGYIAENYRKLDRNTIIKNLTDTTILKLETIEDIYLEVHLMHGRDREVKKEEKIKYKGREREFFKFDDSCLYRGLIKC